MPRNYAIGSQLPLLKGADIETAEFDPYQQDMLPWLALSGMGGLGTGIGSGVGTGSGTGSGTGTGAGGGAGSVIGDIIGQIGGQVGGQIGGGAPEIPSTGGFPEAEEQPSDVVYDQQTGEWGRWEDDPIFGGPIFVPYPRPGEGGVPEAPDAPGGGGAPGGSPGEPSRIPDFGFGGAIYGYPGVYQGDPSTQDPGVLDYLKLANTARGLFMGDSLLNPRSLAQLPMDIKNVIGGESNTQQIRDSSAQMWQNAQDEAFNNFRDAAQAASPETFDPNSIANWEQILGKPMDAFALVEDPFVMNTSPISGGFADIGRVINPYNQSFVDQGKYSFTDKYGFQPLPGYTPYYDADIIEKYGQSSHYDYDIGGYAEGGAPAGWDFLEREGII